MYDCKIESSIIKEILNGAIEEFNNEDCALLGGHTVEDSEIKLGFSITGIITNGKIYRNNTLNEDNLLILTKPIGTGIISTALKGALVDEPALLAATGYMTTSNKKASEIMKKYNVSACTDVTGFSLAGHLYEMANYSNISIYIDVKSIPIIDGTLKYASMGLIPGGAYRNKDFLVPFVDINNSVDEQFIMPLFDPQTSGGLLIGVDPSDGENLLKDLKKNGHFCNIIGKTVSRQNKLIIFT
jgi:selenide,water dikinase